MRRDYFSCVFLLCVCVSLFFVCFEPIYFLYDSIVLREFGLFERIMSAIFAVFVLVIVPVFSAYKKKFWIMVGLAFYGFFTYIPGWILPGLIGKTGLVNEINCFVMKFIYNMTRAPFAAMSVALGDDSARNLTNWIMPVSIGLYVLVQVFRYYRDAYVAEQLDPKSIMDTTAAENKVHIDPEAAKREAPKPEILGTVITAPVKTSATPVVSNTAPAPVSDETQVRIPMNVAGGVGDETLVRIPPVTVDSADKSKPDSKSGDGKLIVNLSGTDPVIAKSSEDSVNKDVKPTTDAKKEGSKLIINVSGTNPEKIDADDSDVKVARKKDDFMNMPDLGDLNGDNDKL